MNEVGIILISHGYFAKYAMESAEMIVGKQKNYEVISVTEDKDLDGVTEELKVAYENLKSDNGIVILADIFGGTPSNACGRLILKGANAQVYTGFSLTVLLELLLSRDENIENIKKQLESVYSEGFINLNKYLKNMGENEGEVL